MALSLFLLSCFGAASDAQGALIFLFMGPIMVLLLVISYLGARKISRKALSRVSLTALAFIVFFFLSLFLPYLNHVPGFIVGGVATVFEEITGMTPYAWSQKQNNLEQMIRDDLLKTNGKEVKFYEFQTGKDWDRVCFLGPYTEPEAARKLLKLPASWHLDDYSSVSRSDGINTLIFLKDENPVYVVEFSRGEADFVNLSKTCLPRQEARWSHTLR